MWSLEGVVVLFINIFKFVRFYLVIYHADFSGDIMLCERDLVRSEISFIEAFYWYRFCTRY